jgi:urea transport system substrate-binding protein
MVTRNKSVQVTAAVLAAGMLFSACGSRTGDSTDTAQSGSSCADTSGPEVKVGTVNALSGATAINEVVIKDVTTMAIDEINASGGVLGKQLSLISEDGASEPTVFAEKAQKLVESDCVAAVFGGYTSASRKAMLPVFEDNNALLFYGTYYEGMEDSQNIFYTGAAPNQQTIPALEYLKEQGVKSLYLVGSDYVYPRTSNSIVKAFAAENGIEILGEDYVPLGGTDFSTIVNKMRSAEADAVFNIVVGDSLVPFFREYTNSGLNPDNMPVISMTVGEEEVGAIGVANVAGQLSSWDYLQTLDTPANTKFVADFKAKFGQDRVTSDAMESAYTGVYLWKALVENANSFDTDEINAAADGVTVEAPEGLVTLDGDNHHISKTARIGEVREDGLIYPVWDSGSPIEPDPYLETYDWASDLN